MEATNLSVSWPTPGCSLVKIASTTPLDPMFAEPLTRATPAASQELSPEDEAIIQAGLAANPGLTREQVIAEAKAHRCL